MTVLSVVQSASLVIGIERPDVLFNGTSRTMLEVQAAINAAAMQIVDEYDWQALTKTATITGDGTATAFPLPDDYYRMVRTAELYSSTTLDWQVQPVSAGDYLSIQTYPISTWRAYWSIFGNALNLAPARAAGETVRFLYISKNAVKPASGAPKPEFTADDDTFVLPERLLRLCFIANWKRDKGFDYGADQNEYEIALNYAQAADQGPRVIRENGATHFGGAVTAWPWELG